MKVVLNTLASDLTQAQLINVGVLVSSYNHTWNIVNGKLIIECENSIEPLKNFLDGCGVKYTYATFPTS
jgi:hypothetical protein